MFDKLLDKKPIVSLDMDHNLPAKLEQLVAAGYSVVEIRTADPSALKPLLQAWPQLTIGVSHVINTHQLENCYQAGVHFATSPGFLPAIAQTASIYSMDYLPGIATLSEAMQVFDLGYQVVRPYPAEASFCQLLAQNIPQLRLIPAPLTQDKLPDFIQIPSVVAYSMPWSQVFA